MSSTARAALNDWVTSEGRRAGEGSLLNPINLGGRLLYREAPARFQFEIGQKLQTALPANPPAPTGVLDLPGLAAGLPPGRARALVDQLAGYATTVDLRARPAASGAAPQGRSVLDDLAPR